MQNILQITILFKILANSNGVILRLDSGIYADFSISLSGLVDSGSLLKSFASKTKRDCALECASFTACKALNFHKASGNCQLVGRTLEQGKNNLISKEGWVYMTTNEEELDIGLNCKRLSPCQNGAVCEDTGEKPGYRCICDSLHSGKHCENERAFASCKEAYETGLRVDGTYKLTDMGHHYCVLSDLNGCSSGGWTLIVKTDGSSTRFTYHSEYWTTDKLYNQIYAAREGLSGEEGKFYAYNKLSFTKVCIGMNWQGETKFLELPRNETSMLSLMKGNTFKMDNLCFAYKPIPYEDSTSAGKSAWLKLVKDSYLHANCRREGFNNKVTGDKLVRIGIFGNNENNCASCDSVLGIGIAGHFGSNNDVKTGVHSSYLVHRKLKAKGFILIQ